MTDKEKVQAKFPEAFAWMFVEGEWLIHSQPNGKEIGIGKTARQAWADAAKGWNDMSDNSTGTELWSRLMDACKRNGLHPGDHNEPFSYIKPVRELESICEELANQMQIHKRMLEMRGVTTVGADAALARYQAIKEKAK